MSISSHVPKGQRYTLGTRIENKYLDLLELAYTAYFSGKEEKAKRIGDCIFTLDTLKFLVQVAWEGKLVSHANYALVAQKLEEVGKMFGGWRKNLENPEKKNRTL